jgi:hypothetical protein
MTLICFYQLMTVSFLTLPGVDHVFLDDPGFILSVVWNVLLCVQYLHMLFWRKARRVTVSRVEMISGSRLETAADISQVFCFVLFCLRDCQSRYTK